MNSVVIFLGCVALAIAGPLHVQQKIDPNLDWRIVGGSAAAAGQFPHQISLRSGGSHICGGSIIGPNKILTAAHCVEGSGPSSLSVMTGSNRLNQPGQVYQVQSLKYHEQWDSNNIVNDVAVITLSSNVAESDTVKQIPLETNDVAGGVPCTLSGWGTTSYPGSIPNDLQFIELSTITVAECQERQSPYPVFDSEVCTFTMSGQGACHGDSGGPLISSGRQIGIVSWGRPCGIGYPDVFTRVSSFTSWINSN